MGLCVFWEAFDPTWREFSMELAAIFIKDHTPQSIVASGRLSKNIFLLNIYIFLNKFDTKCHKIGFAKTRPYNTIQK